MMFGVRALGGPITRTACSFQSNRRRNHQRGNPGGYTEYFPQNPDGSYGLIR